MRDRCSRVRHGGDTAHGGDLQTGGGKGIMAEPGPGRALSPASIRRRRVRKRVLHVLGGYAFIAPYVLFFLVFSVGPTFYGFYMSLFHWQILAKNQPFAGLDNYQHLTNDPLFWISFKNTLYFTALTVCIETAIALIVALCLRDGFRGRSVYRFVFYAPVTLSAAIMGVLMTQLLNAGSLNYYLGFLGLGNFAFLGNSHTVIPAISLVSVWWGFGFPMLVFLAGLYNIPGDVYEAAQIDGAGALQTLLRITMPLLRPTTLFVLVILTIAHFQVFAQMYIMSAGGPGYDSLSIVMYLYQNAWQFYNMGYASAIAVVLALTMATFSGILFKLLGQRFEF
jgi:multiple sugar transport system permease protein